MEVEIGGSSKYVNYKECEEGQILIRGVYVGRAPNKFNPDKEHFVFMDDDDGKVTLNHCGSLENKILNPAIVPCETRLRVEYHGKEVLQSGKFAGREFHNVKVFAITGDDAVKKSNSDAMPWDDEKKADKKSAAVAKEKAGVKASAKKSKPPVDVDDDFEI